MKNIAILIVEDEQIIAENLRFILNDYGYSNVDIAIDASDAEALFKTNNYKLVLMDINLGKDSIVDGVDLIKLLLKNYDFRFIYVTANTDDKTIQKAKVTNPAGYVLKPFINTSIYVNVEMAINHILENDFYVHPDKGLKYKIPLKEITYIKSDGAYINIHTEYDEFFARKSISEFNDQFPEYFIRIHKSTLVNKIYIDGYTSKHVIIKNTTLPIGRNYKNSFLESFKLSEKRKIT